MNALSFLAMAVALSVIGSLFLWLRHRKPTTFMSSIDEFQREMDALARQPVPPRPRRTKSDPAEPIVPAEPREGLARELRSARSRAGRSHRE